jgi:hypothetical protein
MNGATVDQELTRQRIESVANYDAFVDLVLELGTNPEPQLFDFLFAHSLLGGRVGDVAARLLVETDPAPTRSCEELLAEIATSKWDVSVKELPFFLISWFGKRFLKDAYRSFIQTADLTSEQKQRVGTIIYWTAGPAANLIRSHHDWPWREAGDLT